MNFQLSKTNIGLDSVCCLISQEGIIFGWFLINFVLFPLQHKDPHLIIVLIKSQQTLDAT